MTFATLMHADSSDDRLATILALYATGSSGSYSGILWRLALRGLDVRVVAASLGGRAHPVDVGVERTD
jgi:hypothetical protein